MISGSALVLVLVLSVAFVVVSTTRYKVHPFLALILAAYAVGLSSGLGPTKTVASLVGGLGRTAGYIGIVIGCGCIIGTVLEKTGCALVMAETVQRLVGSGRSLLAMACAGALVSIPVFCDSGYVVLSPLARTLSRKTGIPMAAFAVALGIGLYATHCLVPPTPGPVAVAGELRVDLGVMILFGLLVSVPVVGVGLLYAWRLASVLPRTEAAGPEPSALSEPRTNRPSQLEAFAPLVVPVLLIALRSLAELPSRPFGEGAMRDFLAAAGDPNVALVVGVLLAAYAARRHGSGALGGWCGEGVREAGSIILITAAGGAFGAVLRETPLAAAAGSVLSSADLGRFNILLPFVVAAGLKTAIGSSTVAMITTSSLVAPLLPSLGLSSGAGPALASLSVASGAMIVSHVNDSYFWVVTQLSGLTVSQGYRFISFAFLLAGLAGIGTVFLLSLLFL